MKKIMSVTFIFLLASFAFAGDGAHAQSDTVNITDQMNEMREVSQVQSQEAQSKKDAQWQYHQKYLQRLDLNDKK